MLDSRPRGCGRGARRAARSRAGAGGSGRRLTCSHPFPVLSPSLLLCFLFLFYFVSIKRKKKKRQKPCLGRISVRVGVSCERGGSEREGWRRGLHPRGPGSGLCAGLAGARRAESSPFLPKTLPHRLPRGFLRSRAPPRPGCPRTMCAFAPPPAGARGRTSAEGCSGPLPVPSTSPVSNWAKLGQTGPWGGRPCLLLAAGSALCPHVLARGRQRAGLWPRPGTAACCRGGPGGDFSSSTLILWFFSPALLGCRLFSPCPPAARAGCDPSQGGGLVVPPLSPLCPLPHCLRMILAHLGVISVISVFFKPHSNSPMPCVAFGSLEINIYRSACLLPSPTTPPVLGGGLQKAGSTPWLQHGGGVL